MMSDESIELPKGWKFTTLREISSNIYRYPTFYGMKHLTKGVPVIRGEHINSDGSISHDWNDYWFISEELSQNFPRTQLQVEDLVMSVRGTIGKIGLVDTYLQNAQISPNCIRISLNKSLSLPKFILLYLKSFAGQLSISSVSNSTTINTIKASSLSETLIPLPPIAEQKRIVAKIEELRSKTQKAREALEAIPEMCDRFRQSVLAAAFRGDLTADWREENSTLKTTTLAEVIRGKPRNGYSPKPVDYPTKVKSLTLSATTSGRFKPEHFKYINEEIDISSHLWLTPEDILIQRSNTLEYVGTCAIYDGAFGEFIYPDLRGCLESSSRPW